MKTTKKMNEVIALLVVELVQAEPEDNAKIAEVLETKMKTLFITTIKVFL